MVNKDSQDSQ